MIEYVGPACNYRIVHYNGDYIVERSLIDGPGGIWRETNRFQTRDEAVVYIDRTRGMQMDQIAATKDVPIKGRAERKATK